MPKVSIIIPVYNSEAYLDRCLQSVIRQTETDWECFLVDDGSKDGSGTKCDEYVMKDSRFKVFHRTNHGPSSSRNFGIDNSKGDYICFIDSDDYVSESFLKNLLIPLENDSKVGMTVCGVQKFGSVTGKYPNNPSSCVTSSAVVFQHLLGGTSASVKGWLWNKCFRRELLGNFRMREDLRYCEDLEMILRFLFYSHEFQVVYVNTYDYYYYIQKSGNSLSHNVRNKIEMMEKLVPLLDVYPDSKYKRLRIVKSAYSQCRYLTKVENMSTNDKKILNKAKGAIIKNLSVSFKLRKKDVVQVMLILLNYKLYSKVINIIDNQENII